MYWKLIESKNGIQVLNIFKKTNHFEINLDSALKIP